MAETRREFIKKLVEQKHIEQKKKREELFTEKLIEQTKKERQAELEKIKEINIEAPQFNPLKDILRDRAVASQSEFMVKGAKQAGVSAGYVAQENETGNIFILKHFYKNTIAKSIDACTLMLFAIKKIIKIIKSVHCAITLLYPIFPK